MMNLRPVLSFSSVVMTVVPPGELVSELGLSAVELVSPVFGSFRCQCVRSKEPNLPEKSDSRPPTGVEVGGTAGPLAPVRMLLGRLGLGFAKLLQPLTKPDMIRRFKACKIV